MDLDTPLRGAHECRDDMDIKKRPEEMLAMQDIYMDVDGRQCLEQIVEQLPVHVHL